MKRVIDIHEIPRGDYCYTLLKPIQPTMVDGRPGWRIALCPYWERTDNGARCNLLNVVSEKYDENLVWDQVKICGINEGEIETTMTNGWGPFKRRWYSYCSAHQKFSDACNMCASGRWHNCWKTAVSGLIFKLFPSLWIWWVNRR